MDIPAYPEFRQLLREDKAIFDSAFAEYPPRISEFTFTNLYSWREAYQFKVSVWGDLLILRSDSGAFQRFLEPIGAGDKKEAIAMLLRDSRGQGMRIPEETAALFLSDERFRVVEDADNSDYLYAAGDLISLAGAKYDGKRNLIRQFSASHVYTYAAFERATIAECLAFEERWCTIRDCDSVEGLRNERRAIREMADNCSDFRLIAGGITIEGRVSAVAIAEPLNPETLVMHVLKADPSITGLYQTIMHEFLKRNAGAFRYVNLEQDLGIEGLRKSKRSYHPVSMVKKYTLSLQR